MKLVHRLLLAVLLGMAALHAQAGPYFASKDGSMIWDQATGLVWMRCSLGQKWNGKTCLGEASTRYFDVVQEAAKSFNAAGGLGNFTDWVVPTIKQFVTLRACSTGFEGTRDLEDGGGTVLGRCSEGRIQPTIDLKAFPNTSEKAFWSSSPSGGNYAWSVGFDDGNAHGGYLRKSALAVRLVRASQLSGTEVALDFPEKIPAIELVWQQIAGEKEAVRRAAELKAEQARRTAEAERRAAEAERRAAEAERRAAEAARTAAWKKLVTSGAQAMYLQAGKAQRSGSVSVNGVDFYATELYEAIVDKFPTSEYAVKASDQLNAMGRTDAVRQADSNASSRAACFSRVRKCEANCTSSGYSYCIRQCQENCN